MLLRKLERSHKDAQWRESGVHGAFVELKQLQAKHAKELAEAKHKAQEVFRVKH